MAKEMKTQKCCICGKDFTEWGNNPSPIKQDGVCCDHCNWAIVIPARISTLKS